MNPGPLNFAALLLTLNHTLNTLLVRALLAPSALPLAIPILACCHCPAMMDHSSIKLC